MRAIGRPTPAPFLRTNLILHLLNGLLLFALLRALGRRLGTSSEQGTMPWRCWRPGCGCCIRCSCRPPFMSCSARPCSRPPSSCWACLRTCTAANLAEDTHGERGVPWMIAGIVLGTGLAMLCKGNGILLPSLALVLEFTVLKSRSPESLSPGLKRWRIGLLVLPSIALLVYLLSFLSALHRPWVIDPGRSHSAC